MSEENFLDTIEELRRECCEKERECEKERLENKNKLPLTKAQECRERERKEL